MLVTMGSYVWPRNGLSVSVLISLKPDAIGSA